MKTGHRIEIREVGRGASVRDWLLAKHRAHEGDPAFVAPLNILEKRRISPRRNPFFKAGEAALFVAFSAGRPVGRISAQINRRDLKSMEERTGQFGFFDVVDDLEVATRLVEAARTWLSARGCLGMRGPYNFSVNEECGCQIDGFHLQPTYLMPQARPWTGPLLEACGLTKVMDLHAYRVRTEDAISRLERLSQMAGEFKSVRARPIRIDRFQEEIRLLADIVNDGWSGNWGFVPISAEEVDALAAELKAVYRSTYGSFVGIDGKTVGTLIAIPNVNEAIAAFKGRLTPMNVLKLFFALKREKLASTRIALAGLRQAYQSGIMGAVLCAALARPALEEATRTKIKWVEFSWVLEENFTTRRFLAEIGAKPAIGLRIYSTV